MKEQMRNRNVSLVQICPPKRPVKVLGNFDGKCSIPLGDP